MSGGSYEYLYIKEIGEVLNRADLLRQMADRLDEFEAHDAAAETRLLLALRRQAQAHADRLSDVWHAIEWRDSGDYGDDGVREALAKYRGEGS